VKQVTVLYTQPRSVYLSLPDVDCWDAARDARRWPGHTPVVAHPPCRLWGGLRHQSTAPREERLLAWHAVQMVERYGGVLEHPALSTLWRNQGLPWPQQGTRLSYTIPIQQLWFGHKARKPTWLWIRGVPLELLPDVPFRWGEGTHVVTWSNGCRRRPKLSARGRQETPRELAEWLVAVARLVPDDFCTNN
jgi:hypothetical protein